SLHGLAEPRATNAAQCHPGLLRSAGFGRGPERATASLRGQHPDLGTSFALPPPERHGSRTARPVRVVEIGERRPKTMGGRAMSSGRCPQPVSPVIALLDEQGRRWRRGECPTVEQFLEVEPALLDEPE